MIKVTISYSVDSVQSYCFEIEMSVLQRPLMKEQGMQLQYQFRDSQRGQVRITGKGLLDGYAPWSESPTALALRALHTLYTDWSESIPAELTLGRTVSMQVDIAYVLGTTATTLTSSSVTRALGTEESYYMQRSIDGAATWPVQIRSEAAVPLGTALKFVVV